ncbi:transcription factor DIVARICATA-like [Senna tora]|uniref:Transcription factor DIVARICATA-like n=1 Tax=Senna tora TaxID=362788 RepID=A0A834VX12_9FABA|nr:transcription factor DIVARICATA-like [Senna tora]
MRIPSNSPDMIRNPNLTAEENERNESSQGGGGGAGKTIGDVKRQIEVLMEDIQNIEAGFVVMPNYDKAIPGFSWDYGVNSAPTFQVSEEPYGRRPCPSMRYTESGRKKGVPWTEEEHRMFLVGLEKCGKGDWRTISRVFVVTRTPTQVASHAQKFFIRQNTAGKERRRASIHDITTPMCTPNHIHHHTTSPPISIPPHTCQRHTFSSHASPQHFHHSSSQPPPPQHFHHSSFPQHFNRSSSPRHFLQSFPPQHFNQSSSPQQIIQSSSPQHFNQSFPPQHFNQSSPPQQIIQSSSPQQFNQSSSPQQIIQSLSTQQFNQSCSPQQFNQSSSPQQFNHSYAPQQIIQSSSTQQFNQSSSTQQFNQSCSPQQFNQSYSPQQFNQSCSPQQFNHSSSTQQFNHLQQSYSPEQFNQSFPPPHLVSHSSSPQQFHHHSSSPSQFQWSQQQHNVGGVVMDDALGDVPAHDDGNNGTLMLHPYVSQEFKMSDDQMRRLDDLVRLTQSQNMRRNGHAV